MAAQVLTPLDDGIARCGTLKLFLAGGISGAPDWQSEFIHHVQDLDVTIFNPRCKVFEEKFDDVKHDAQVTWEYQRLRGSHIISFWFLKEAPCMVTLYELGFVLAERWCALGKSLQRKIFIGVEPGYKKQRTVRVQTKLVAPDIRIVDSLSELAYQVRGAVIDGL